MPIEHDDFEVITVESPAAPSVITVAVPGPLGPLGPTPTMSIGTVATGTAGAVITGTAPNFVLNLTLPSTPVHQHVSADITDATDAATASTIVRRDAAGAFKVADFSSIAASSLDNKFFSPNSMTLAQGPFADLWHDTMAFGRHIGSPIFETSADGVTWVAPGSFNKNYFMQKNGAPATLIDAATAPGSRVRWTWNHSNLVYQASSNGAWLVLSWSHGGAGGAAGRVVRVESSADGTTWTTRHLSNYALDACPIWHYVKDWGTDDKLRVTVSHTAGGNSLVMTTMRLLTARWGDQGGGSELSLPYDWDADRGLVFERAYSKTAPSTASELTRKDYVDLQVGTRAPTSHNHTQAQVSLVIATQPASVLPAAIPDGYSIFASNSGLIDGWPADLIVVESVKINTIRILQRVTEKMTSIQWVRTSNANGDGWSPFSKTVTSGITISAGTGLIGGGDLSANRSLSVSYGSAAGTSVEGNDLRVTADQAAGTASIRTIGTGALQAAAGSHTHADHADITSATAAATASTIAKRDVNGAVAFSSVTLTGQVAPTDATRKDYVDGLTAQATTEALGTVELATEAEAVLGIDPARAISPATMQAALDLLSNVARSGDFSHILNLPNLPEIVFNNGTVDPVRPSTTRTVIFVCPDNDRPATNGSTAGGTYATVAGLDFVWAYI